MPLRALPEHSVATEEEVQTSATRASIKHSEALHHSLNRVTKGASTDDQLKGEQTAIREIVGDIPAEQPPAPSLNTSHTPEAQGIAGKDFASESSASSSQQVTAGRTTFNLPNFEERSLSTGAGAAGDDILSPTSSRSEH